MINLIQVFKISSITKTLNFLLACFKKMQNHRRIIYELDISLQNDSNCKPDLFCLLVEEGEFYYSLFEIKARTVFSEEDINEKIKPQYLSYQNITVNDLDDYLIPRIQNTTIYINYLFYDSERQIIDQIINSVPIQSNVYHLNLNERQIIAIQSNSGNLNDQLMEKIIELSQETSLWNKIYVPFTFKDIQDFRGKGGKEVDIHNRSGIILAVNFMMFVLSRKIRKEDTLFLVDDFINYVFQNNFENLNVGWEQRKTFKKKFRLFLQFICNELPKKIDIDPIIEKTDGYYRILLRHTATLERRISEITQELIKFLKQKRLPEFY